MAMFGDLVDAMNALPFFGVDAGVTITDLLAGCDS